MIAEHTPGALKRFGRTQWRFQRTFETPLNDLERFVGTILSGLDEIDSAIVVVDQYVFEPKGFNTLVANLSPAVTIGHNLSLTASNREEVHALLEASFGDWVDFLFVPQPKRFVIFADHDEFATFYAAFKSNLNHVTGKLIEARFTEVAGFRREY